MRDYATMERDRAEVSRRLDYLTEQLKLADALTHILRSGYRDRDTSERCHVVERHLYRVMIQNVERIWLLSGGSLTERDDQDLDSREGQDDSPSL